MGRLSLNLAAAKTVSAEKQIPKQADHSGRWDPHVDGPLSRGFLKHWIGVGGRLCFMPPVNHQAGCHGSPVATCDAQKTAVRIDTVTLFALNLRGSPRDGPNAEAAATLI